MSPIQKRRRPAGKRFPDEIPESPWRVPGGSSSSSSTIPTDTTPVLDDADAATLSSRKLILQMRGMQLGEQEEVAVVEGESPDNMEIELHPAVKRRRSSASEDLDEEVHDQDTEMVAMENGMLPHRGNAKGKAKSVVMLDGASSPANDPGSRRLRSPPPDSSQSQEAPEETAKSMDTSKEDEDLSDDVDGYGIAYAPTPQQRDMRRQKRLQQVSLCGCVRGRHILRLDIRSGTTKPENPERQGSVGLSSGGGGGQARLRPLGLVAAIARRKIHQMKGRRRACIFMFNEARIYDVDDLVGLALRFEMVYAAGVMGGFVYHCRYGIRKYLIISPPRPMTRNIEPSSAELLYGHIFPLSCQLQPLHLRMIQYIIQEYTSTRPLSPHPIHSIITKTCTTSLPSPSLSSPAPLPASA